MSVCKLLKASRARLAKALPDHTHHALQDCAMTATRVPYAPYRPVFPSPTGLITSVDEAGNANIITLGEVFNLSIRKPVIVGIAIDPARYSHELISRQGEFVVNLPPGDLWPRVLECGSVSGREVDKFAAYGLTALPATHVKPPLIAECVLNIECRVRDIQSIGDHDLFQGEVLAVHANPAYTNESGALDPTRFSTVVMTGIGVFDLGRRL
jgi:flavin reductase (DIM6/NTAB) family NADH-FMN oxidoreductase RutF